MTLRCRVVYSSIVQHMFRPRGLERPLTAVALHIHALFEASTNTRNSSRTTSSSRHVRRRHGHCAHRTGLTIATGTANVRHSRLQRPASAVRTSSPSGSREQSCSLRCPFTALPPALLIDCDAMSLQLLSDESLPLSSPLSLAPHNKRMSCAATSQV